MRLPFAVTRRSSFRWSWEVEDTFTKGIVIDDSTLLFDHSVVSLSIHAVAKGQKMAMKNYAKQLNTQIEEVVAEVNHGGR